MGVKLKVVCPKFSALSQVVFVIGVIARHIQARSHLELKTRTSSLYYKHIMIVNYDSSIINKLGASLTDDNRVVIYDRHMFIVQAGNT